MFIGNMYSRFAFWLLELGWSLAHAPQPPSLSKHLQVPNERNAWIYPWFECMHSNQSMLFRFSFSLSFCQWLCFPYWFLLITEFKFIIIENIIIENMVGNQVQSSKHFQVCVWMCLSRIRGENSMTFELNVDLHTIKYRINVIGPDLEYLMPSSRSNNRIHSKSHYYFPRTIQLENWMQRKN